MRYSVDAIARYRSCDNNNGKFVVIRRLNYPFGLAFPGGGIEDVEGVAFAVTRETKEETGLDFDSMGWMPKPYDKTGRDPRWPATSHVAFGILYGTPSNEAGKTEVLFLSKEEILARGEEFAFDHFQIFLDYLAYTVQS
jgi:ADP-ribose pyrophosphatase YjhB (NUDIX family)